MSEFKFAIGGTVRLKMSDETGEVVGRAEYANSEPSYYVRYRAGNGCQVTEWLAESALLS